MPRDRQVEYLPEGWQWRSKGQDGKTARHALNPQGEVVSLRQVQNMQRARRAELGQPKPPSIRRRGRIHTRQTPGGLPTNVTSSPVQHLPEGVGSLYNPNQHGQIQTWTFYDFQDAMRGVMIDYKPPEWAKYGIIKVRYTERLRSTDRTGSDVVGQKNGYSTLSWIADPQDMQMNAPNVGQSLGIWDLAAQRLSNYDMSGSNARVYIEWQER